MSLGLLRKPPAGSGGTKLKAAGQHDSARALNQHAPTRHPQAAGELSVCADSALGMRDESDSERQAQRMRRALVQMNRCQFNH